MTDHDSSTARDPASLARMFVLDETGWDEDSPAVDLAAMLAHQLAAPLAADLKLIPQQQTDTAEIPTFAALLQHDRPPKWLLEETKDLAKRTRAHTDASARQIATMLYYLAIAAAQVRCSERISDLTPQQLEDGFTWALAQPWTDPMSKRLIESARKPQP